MFAFFTYIISLYNYILFQQNKVKNAYSSLDVMLKKRYDLIPNLVAVVKQYTKHENQVLKSLVELREQLLKSSSPSEIAERNADLNNNLNQILLRIENYPDLKASEQFLNLQNSLIDVENHISAARRTYNAHVTRYNNIIGVFPNNFFASAFKFKRMKWFEFEERKDIKVDFDEDK